MAHTRRREKLRNCPREDDPRKVRYGENPRPSTLVTSGRPKRACMWVIVPSISRRPSRSAKIRFHAASACPSGVAHLRTSFPKLAPRANNLSGRNENESLRHSETNTSQAETSLLENLTSWNGEQTLSDKYINQFVKKI